MMKERAALVSWAALRGRGAPATAGGSPALHGLGGFGVDGMLKEDVDLVA